MRSLTAWIFFVLIGILPAAAQTRSEKEPAAEPVVQTIKTADGIQFLLPEDWPVVRRGGGVGPVPIEEYLTIKFNKVEERIRTLEERLAALEGKAEERPARQGPRLRSSENFAQVPGALMSGAAEERREDV